MANSFHVLEVARLVVGDVNRLLEDPALDVMHRSQLRDAAQSIPANIREGLGRDPGPDRNKCYRVARGSAEETDEHLRANVDRARIPEPDFWRIHHRLTLIVKMLNAAMKAKYPAPTRPNRTP